MTHNHWSIKANNEAKYFSKLFMKKPLSSIFIALFGYVNMLYYSVLSLSVHSPKMSPRIAELKFSYVLYFLHLVKGQQAEKKTIRLLISGNLGLGSLCYRQATILAIPFVIYLCITQNKV